MAANGNQRNACDRTPLYRAGRSVPERQDHIARSDPRAHRRDRAPGHVEAGNTVGDAQQGSAPSRMSVELTVATTNFMGDAYTFLDCPGSVEFVARHARGAAGGRCRGRRLRNGREESPAAPAHPARARRAENPALPVPQQDRQGRRRRARRAQSAAAGLAHQADPAADPDLRRRYHQRLRRSRARTRLCLQGARRLAKSFRSKATSPIARRRRASPCWKRSPTTTTS